jgi:hypothetical protein
MTETSTPAAREITEFVVCADCAIVLANGDSSGIPDAAGHLAAMDVELAGVRNVVIVGEADRGFCTDTCGACGTYTAADDWYDATAEIAPIVTL